MVFVLGICQQALINGRFYCWGKNQKIGKLTKNAFVSYVDVNMVEHREKYGRKK